MGNFDNGYIRVYRKMLDWEWFSDVNTFYVFMYCLLKANWKTKNWRGIEIKRGSFITSRNKLARELRLSEREVRTALEHLETTNEVTKSGNARYTVITVVKYDDYQTSDQLNDQETTNKSTSKKTNRRPSKDQVTTTTEESNKDNKGKKKRVKPPHRGWIPYVYHDSEWLRAHDPRDGWRFTEIDGVGWAYQEKVEG